MGCSDIMRRKGCRDFHTPLRPRVERKKTMAQDFGDDIGEMLFTGFKRSFERAIYDFWRESRNNNRDEEWYRNKFMKEGMSEEDAEAAAKDMAGLCPLRR